MPTKSDIIAEILEIMARHNLTPADIEDSETQPEPQVSERQPHYE